MSALKVVRVEDIERSNTEDFPKSTPRENTTQSTSVNFYWLKYKWCSACNYCQTNIMQTIFISVEVKTCLYKEQMYVFLDAEYINTTELDQGLAENEAEKSQGKHGIASGVSHFIIIG